MVDVLTTKVKAWEKERGVPFLCDKVLKKKKKKKKKKKEAKPLGQSLNTDNVTKTPIGRRIGIHLDVLLLLVAKIIEAMPLYR
ncbi:unnamed protein product [Arabidopsis halleri]